jgi:sulfotransferase family protein
MMSRDASPLRDRMIFLVGARRSGTNWLQRVVGAHPDVAVVPSETYLFSRGIAPLAQRFHHGVRGSPGTGFVYMDEHDLLDALRDFCDRTFAPFLRATPGATRLAERTPEHVTCLDVIGRVYPDAHVVHIVRDGRDVARSLLNQDWASAPRTIDKAAEEWRFCIEAAEASAGSLERYRVVRYEELLADPLTHVAELYGWLGLPGGTHVVEAALVEAEVRFNASPGVAIGAEKWRQTFSEADLQTFMNVAGDALQRLGYDVTPRSDGPAPPSTPARSRRKLMRRGKSETPHDASFERRVSGLVTDTQRTMDRVITAVNTKDIGTLAAFMTDTVWVRSVSPDGEWKGRGPAAWSRLAERIAADEALVGKQLRGDLYPALPASTAVMYFETPNGAQHVRAIAVTLQGDRVARFTYYEIPQGG